MPHVLSVFKLANAEPVHRRHPLSHKLKNSLDVPAAHTSKADSPSAGLGPATLSAQ